MVVKSFNSDRKDNTEKEILQSFTTMELQNIRNKFEKLQTKMFCDVQNQNSAIFNDFMQEHNQHELKCHELLNVNTTPEEVQSSLRKSNLDICQAEPNGFYKDVILSNSVEVTTESPQTKLKLHRTFSEKIYSTRESYLTTLLKVEHMKTIYHIFCVIFILFCMNNILYEYQLKGSITFGLTTFKIGFSKIHYVFGAWMLQLLFVFGIYYAVKGWFFVRTKLEKSKFLQHMWSLACLTAYITTQISFASMPAMLCLMLNLPFVSAFVLLIECVRMLMKMHSFVRTMCDRILKGKKKIEGAAVAVDMPPFKKYLYFLFAPTLLYRDMYPRTCFIRWKFAVARLMEITAVAFLFSYIFERHIRPTFGNFGIEEISGASMTVKLFGMLMPCTIIFLCTFYMILHSWLNFTAELLCFGDRMFYRDWWTAYNYDGYYRTWNIVVHDWLYEYVYKDVYRHILKGSKLASSLIVFLISAMFHEYILGFALQMFFPVMFVFFDIIGVSMIFITRFVPKAVGNILLWLSLIYGNTLMISLYSMEYFAIVNCPNENREKLPDKLLPHLYYCYYK